MDINIKIIEGVRELSPLHDNSCNLEERNKAWTQLAEKLKMSAQILKIRWHSLLQEYQRDGNFKYANIMNFVCLSTEGNNDDNWPEFIITEEYLKDEKPEEREQFVFLETEEEDNSKCCKSPIKIERHLKEIEKFNNKALKNEDHARSDERKEIEQSKETQVENAKIPHHRSNVTTSNVEEKMAIVDLTKNESSTNNKELVVYEKPLPAIAERCEDVIFGELVSAMLKRMDEDKKKNIKREIMNLLFS